MILRVRLSVVVGWSLIAAVAVTCLVAALSDSLLLIAGVFVFAAGVVVGSVVTDLERNEEQAE